MSPEHETMRELLAYPNAEGIHPNEARWRDFARELIKEYEAKLRECDEIIDKVNRQFDEPKGD